MSAASEAEFRPCSNVKQWSSARREGTGHYTARRSAARFRLANTKLTVRIAPPAEHITTRVSSRECESMRPVATREHDDAMRIQCSLAPWHTHRPKQLKPKSAAHAASAALGRRRSTTVEHEHIRRLLSSAGCTPRVHIPRRQQR